MLLTAGERVLLHLLNFWNAKDPPEAVTQQGIAEAARLRRSHVPRTVKALAREAYVEERDGRVHGRGRKVRLYYLTESGLRRARELAKALDAQAMVADGGPTTLGEFAKASGRSLLEIALDLDESGRYRGGATEFALPAFLGRRDELAALAAWIRGPGPAMVVYGAVGMGKTALARRFLQRSPRPYLWRELRPGDTAPAILADLAEFLADKERTRLSEALAANGDPWEAIAVDLDGLEVLLVFDGYGDVLEDVVDAFGHLLRLLGGSPRAKALILAQEATPSYCRFYDRRAVEDRRVEEIHLRGLTMDESKELLGNREIAEEALRRIYLLTKGCPLYLELIRERDGKRLKARSRFTTAEVNLLLFSRDVVS
jgi:DNA-binding MarR family transcriptional regulator